MTLTKVPGFDDCLVDQMGCVISLKFGRRRTLKPMKQPSGYLVVVLLRDMVRHKFLVHVLVARTFLGLKEDMMVNHLNGVKHDNRLENLEYCTASENVKHAYRIGLHAKSLRLRSERYAGEKSPKAKLSNQQAEELLALKGTMSTREAAKLFGIGYSQVGQIWRGTSRKHLQKEES